MNIEYLKENGVDVDRGLELLGDIDTYNDILKEFITNNEERCHRSTCFKRRF